jgi:peptidoglycan/LPS O-acetylase OafA/YrhL
MKRSRPYQILMRACQFGIVLGIVVPNNGDYLWAAILYAAMFGGAVSVLVDMPRGIIRWSVAALCAAAFATLFCLTWSSPAQTRSPPSIMAAILISLFSCMFVAGVIATVKWLAQLPDQIRPPYWWPEALGGPSNAEREFLDEG